MHHHNVSKKMIDIQPVSYTHLDVYKRQALRQRITVHYNYAGLSDNEVSKYILHKLQLAGAASTIIEPAALAAAHSFTQGNPRLIDNLMTDALTIGFQRLLQK